MGLDRVILVAAVLTFLAILLLCASLALYLHDRTRRRTLLERIKEAPEQEHSAGVKPFTLIHRPAPGFPWNLFGWLGGRLTPAGEGGSMERLRFLRAGLRSPNAPAVFWGVKCILAAAFPLCFSLILLAAGRGLSPANSMLIGIAVALAGFYLPDLWIAHESFEAAVRAPQQACRMPSIFWWFASKRVWDWIQRSTGWGRK